jgi:hypothetical protein
MDRLSQPIEAPHDHGASTNTYVPTHDDFDNASSINHDPTGEIIPHHTENTIYTKSPEGRFTLGTWSVIGLIVNRVVGQ